MKLINESETSSGKESENKESTSENKTGEESNPLKDWMQEAFERKSKQEEKRKKENEYEIRKLKREKGRKK